MKKEECFNLGHISKTFGIKGEVVLWLDVDYPENYKNLKSIYVEVNNLIVEYFIEHTRIKKNLAFVKIKGIDKIEQAEIILKCDVFLPLTHLPKLEGNDFYLHEVPGFKVIDNVHGDIGILKSVIELTNNRLLQVMKDKVEILIPLNLDFITNTDRENKILYISAPEGLIDLYLNPPKSNKEDDLLFS